MLRIMFVAGLSIHSERWVSFFAQRGHDVVWVSLGSAAQREYGNVHFVEIPKRPFRPFRPLAYVVALKNLIRKVKPDVLHAHQVWIDGIVAAATGFQPLVITPWGSDVLVGGRSQLKRPLMSAALKRAAVVTCDGENTAAAVEGLGVLRRNIEIICFGVNVDHFTPDVSGEEVRRRLRLEGRRIVVSLRSLNPLYDVETLVRAASIVLKKCSGAAFVVAGNGIQLSELQALVNTLQISDAVHFVGQVPQAELPAYLAAADVYVSTALSDSGLAASTAEAMACGLPVVITDTGANRDWITDGSNGYIIPVRSPETLAQKIVELLDDHCRRQEWGRINRGIIVARNNYAREMTAMEKLYVQVSGRAQRGTQ